MLVYRKPVHITDDNECSAPERVRRCDVKLPHRDDKLPAMNVNVNEWFAMEW